MKYFTLYEYILGSISFVILGLTLSFLASIIYQLVFSASSILNFIKNTYKCNSLKEIKSKVIGTKSRAEYNFGRKSNVGDFIVSILFSSLVIILNYSYFDGIPRLFPIILSLFSFVAFRRLSNKIIIGIFNTAAFIPRILFSHVLYLALIPVKIITRRIFALSKVASYPIIRHFKKIKSHRITEGKMKKLRKFIAE